MAGARRHRVWLSDADQVASDEALRSIQRLTQARTTADVEVARQWLGRLPLARCPAGSAFARSPTVSTVGISRPRVHDDLGRIRGGPGKDGV